MSRYPKSFAPVALTLIAIVTSTNSAAADQPLGTMKVKSFNLTWVNHGFAQLRMTGTAEELGKCTAYSELDFVPGEQKGTLEGVGVVAFTAANGDLLVGVVSADIDSVAGILTAEIHWRNAVTVADGTIVASTGRFVRQRPPGIIAILIGL